MVPLGLLGLLGPTLSRAAGAPVPVAANLEVVDHVVPGVVVLAVAAAVLVLRRLSLVATLLAALAGFWITATHVPLLLQAERGEIGWTGALIHSAGGILILTAALVGAVMAWNEPGSGPPRA